MTHFRIATFWLALPLTSSMCVLTRAAVPPPYGLRTLPTTVHVGETYSVWFEATANGDSVHDIVLDGISASTDAQAGRVSCESAAAGCRFWRPYAATSVGERRHVVNGKQSNGQPWGQVSLAVDVRPPPEYAAGWELKQTISHDARTYQGVAASNGVVLVTDSDSGSNTTRVKRSADHGQTFGPWIDLPGSGTAYIEQPVGISGPYAVILGVDATEHVTDFCCARQVGPMIVWRSTDGGMNWTRQMIFSAAKGLRVSVAVEGATAHAAWMDYRRGLWDLYHARSNDNGVSWVEQVVAFGTNATGAERPSMAFNGSTVWLAWMDARDNQTQCEIEGSLLLPFCTEIYIAKSDDNGATFNVSRLTDTTGYAGRPAIDLADDVLTVAFDFRPLTMKQPNQIMVTSTTEGVLWTPVRPVSPSGTEQTHAVLASVGGVIEAVWMDARTGHYELREQLVRGLPSRIPDAARTATDQRLTPGSSVGSVGADDAYVYAVSQVFGTMRLLRRSIGSTPQPPLRFARPRRAHE